jgi:hypothetical protein
MAHIVSFSDHKQASLRIAAQTSIVIRMLLADLEDAGNHRDHCATRLSELIKLFEPNFLDVPDVEEHLTALAALPAEHRIDRIAHHLTQHLDTAGATVLPDVPEYECDHEVVRAYADRAAIILRYALYLQTCSVMSRRLAS